MFPLFFFLVAALVCITTMTRMVGEQRTENGVLKALGYGEWAVTGQYLAYAGSASAVGCVLGFLLGSRYMPMALWQVYRIMYSVNRPIQFVLDWKLFFLCSALYLFCALAPPGWCAAGTCGRAPPSSCAPRRPQRAGGSCWSGWDLCGTGSHFSIRYPSATSCGTRSG